MNKVQGCNYFSFSKRHINSSVLTRFRLKRYRYCHTILFWFKANQAPDWQANRFVFAEQMIKLNDSGLCFTVQSWTLRWIILCRVGRGIVQYILNDVRESLMSLTKNERSERIAQRKWAIVSKSLRSLTKNERMSESLIFLSKSLIRSFLVKKRAIRSENRWANSQPWEFDYLL